MPKFILGAGGLSLVLASVFAKEKVFRFISHSALTVVGLALVALFLSYTQVDVLMRTRGLQIGDEFVYYIHFLVLATLFILLLLSHRHSPSSFTDRPETPILMLFSALGLLILTSSYTLLNLYVGLELLSLPIYVLTAIGRRGSAQAEAALKYFILGTIASIFFLYGSSFVYGYTGAINFNLMASRLENIETVPYFLTFGIILVTTGFAFKISAAPFHMWAPDVYQGSPTPITVFIATLPKIAGIVALMYLLLGPFVTFGYIWQPILQILAVTSMIFGVFGALFQTNIKRFLAYSTVSHAGFMLVGLSTGTEAGVQGVLVYLSLYLVMTLGMFSVLLNLRRQGEIIQDLSDLNGLSQLNSGLALTLAILLFSLAGIPPLAGFFAKFFVLLPAVEKGTYAIVITAVLMSVIAASYYLNIIKRIYFMPAVGGDSALSYDRIQGQDKILIIVLLAGFTLLFFVNPNCVLDAAKAAALTLFKS